MSYQLLSLFRRFRRTRVYVPSLHNPSVKRLNWEQIEAKPQREGKQVVKGTNKRVIVVKSPDPKVFEQAIFIVREDYSSGLEKHHVLLEAEKIANSYFTTAVGKPGRILRRIPKWAFAAAGALLSAFVCLTVVYYLL